MQRPLKQLKRECRERGIPLDVFVRNPNDERALAAGCYVDFDAAARVINFFELVLRHSKGKRFRGKPFELLTWEKRDLAYLFGWKMARLPHEAEGRRRFTHAYWSMAKKNGKSTVAGGIAAYLSEIDGEPRGNIAFAATTRAQARICFDEAAAFIRSSPILKKQMEVTESTGHIYSRTSGTTMKAIAAEAFTAEGLDLSACIIDELHAHKNRQFFDALYYAGEARAEPLNLVITTAGDDVTSIGYEQYQYAKGVIDGSVEDIRFFAQIYEVLPEDDWTDPEVWKKANPSMGEEGDEDAVLSLSRMRRAFEEARASPSKENAFRRYRLNQWVNQAKLWIPFDEWKRGDEPLRDGFAGLDCWGAMDLSATRDTTSFVLVFPWEDGTFDVLPFFWLPENPERKGRTVDLFRQWSHRKFRYAGMAEEIPLVSLCEGATINQGDVKDRILWAAETFELREIAFDRWGAKRLVEELSDEGVEMLAHEQGFNGMNYPSTTFESAVFGGKIRHQGHPVLRWQVHNLAKRESQGRIMPDKNKSGDKIDGPVAMIMALGRASLGETGSVYETRGPIIV